MASIKHLVDLDLSKNQLLNAVVQNLASPPSSPLEGQIYWSTADDTLYVYDLQNTTWIDLGASGVTNLGYTASASNGIVTSNTGTNATIPLTGATNAGLFSAAQKTKLDGIAAGADVNVGTNIAESTTTNTTVLVTSSTGNNATLNSATTSRAGLMSKAKFDEVEANNAKVSDINHNVSTNLSVTNTTTTNTVNSSDGTNATLTAASTSKAGVMTKAIFDEHVINNAKVSNVDETLTSISIASNVITYTDEDGVDTDIDLSLYLDDTNLSRITSGSINGTTGVATFTRSDASTFTIDMSDFLDAITLNNTLTSTSTTEGLTAAQGKVLKDLIDGLNTSTGTNTGDEPDSSTTVKGIIETATQTEVDNGTAGIRAVIPSTLRSTLGITATLATTLTYTQLVGGSTSQVITHSIGNQFVQVQVFEVAGMDKVECEIELTSATTTTLKFNTAPAANSLRVVIIG